MNGDSRDRRSSRSRGSFSRGGRPFRGGSRGRGGFRGRGREPRGGFSRGREPRGGFSSRGRFERSQGVSHYRESFDRGPPKDYSRPREYRPPPRSPPMDRERPAYSNPSYRESRPPVRTYEYDRGYGGGEPDYRNTSASRDYMPPMSRDYQRSREYPPQPSRPYPTDDMRTMEPRREYPPSGRYDGPPAARRDYEPAPPTYSRYESYSSADGRDYESRSMGAATRMPPSDPYSRMSDRAPPMRDDRSRDGGMRRPPPRGDTPPFKRMKGGVPPGRGSSMHRSSSRGGPPRRY